MRDCRFLCLSALFLIALSANAQYRTDYSDLNDSETVRALKSHVMYVSSSAMEGRKAGGEGERLTADYVETVFKSYGVDVLSGNEGDVFGIKKDNGDTLTSRNVTGFVQGYDTALNGRYIVVGARMDNLGVNSLKVDGKETEQIYYGANGNGSGIAALLELARLVATNQAFFRRSVIFVAFGASSEGFAGSWYFLNRSFSDVSRIDAMINLDMLGTGSSGFYAFTSSNEDLNLMLRKLSSQLQPIKPELTSAEPYPSDHRAFYSKQIPSVYFTTGKYVEHNTSKDTESIVQYDYLEKELEYIFNFSRELANADKAPSFSNSPTVKKPSEGRLYSISECDNPPVFLGSGDPRVFLSKWVYKYLKYPEQAVREGIQGRVHVYFVIAPDGSVKNVRVEKGVDPLLDDEAVKVIEASPKWKPARLGGEKVSCYMTLVVEFKLTKKSTFGIKKY